MWSSKHKQALCIVYWCKEGWTCSWDCSFEEEGIGKGVIECRYLLCVQIIDNDMWGSCMCLFV